MPQIDDELDYTVEIWTRGFASVERTLARCARVDIARGAYRVAVMVYTDEWLTLRHKTRVVMEHIPED